MRRTAPKQPIKNSSYTRKTRFLTRQNSPKKAGCRLNWGTEKPEVKLEDLIRLAEISADHEKAYVRPEEVRKNLVKAGFELWETSQ